METLENLMNEKLNLLGIRKYKNLKDFINDDKKSADFIRIVLHDPKFAASDEDDISTSVAQARARHSAVTFLMGLIFHGFIDLKMTWQIIGAI